MFRNKFTILLTVLILFGIAIGLHFIGSNKHETHNAITIMPADAAIVIETKDFASLLDNFSKNNQYKNLFSSISEWKGVFDNVDFINSIIGDSKDIKDLFEDKKVIISARVGVGNMLEFMYCLPVYDSDNEELINKKINSLLTETQEIKDQIYDGKKLYNFIDFDKAQRLFTYTIADGLLIISREKSLIEETLRNLKKPEDIVIDNGFVKVSETAGNNSDMNIYINYAQFPNSLKSVLSISESSFFDFFNKFADWTELDMRYKDKSLFMSGFTYLDQSKKRYLKVLNNQSPLTNDFLTALPGNTAAFVAFNMSDPIQWMKNHDSFLQETGEYTNIAQKIETIKARTSINIKNIFFSNIEGAVCAAWINKNIAASEQEVIGVMELSDEENFETILEGIQENDSLEVNPNVGNNKVYKINEPKLFRYLFGEIFSELESRYFMISDERLIVAGSMEALQLYFHKISANGKLIDNKNFNNFSKNLSSESNIYAYLNLAASKPLLIQSLNKDNSQIYKKNIDKFEKIYALAIQFGVSKHGIYTNVCSNINSVIKKIENNSWELKFDNPSKMKPCIVKNHYTGNEEILLQDNAHNLSLVSTQGKKLWTKMIDSKILGEIHQVDKYKNNKIQYLFNTRNKLYLVDRNGKDVEGFPLTFASPATNPCAAFDYDHNKQYRILVACTDKKMRMYTIEGKTVKGWNPAPTQGLVNMPAQHFVDNGKDYIFYADLENTYIVDRKGNTRIKLEAQFTKNANAEFFFEHSSESNKSKFVTTGQSDYVYFIYLDGSVKKMQLSSFSTKHQFNYIDIDGSGKKQFVIADKNKLTVYNRDKTIRFELKFDGNINNSLNAYRFGNNLYLGVTPEGENKIYLINTNGEIVKGFPLSGSGPFSISKLDKKDSSNKLNVITINSSNYLVNYSIEID